MEKKNRVYTAGTGKHRAAIIVINSKIDAILIAQISDEDTVVLEIVHRKQMFSCQYVLRSRKRNRKQILQNELDNEL